MLYLHKIILTQFKNYEVQSFSFNAPVIGICGLNGKGKTNLLDAIYYSCFTKSYFPGSDAVNINYNKEGFRIESDFTINELPQKIVCINKINAKKEFYLNDIQYEKLSSHIGLLPAVIVTPDNIDIINGSSEGRRKFLDTIICQIDSDYLQDLILYNKLLQQRNAFLKNNSSNRNYDIGLLDVIDQQMMPPSERIHTKRVEFTQVLLPLVHEFYQTISGNAEKIELSFESKLNTEKIQSILLNNRAKDILLQRTQSGIHRDDLYFGMNEQLFKNMASQGQKKSLLFALKFAEYELIKKVKGFSPLLLLDDIFEKLDNSRMINLLNWVCNNNGQVFITDTHKERLLQSFENLGIKGQVIELI